MPDILGKSPEREGISKTRLLIEGKLRGAALDSVLGDVKPMITLPSFLLPRLGDMSIEELASRAAIGRSTIYAVMNGKKRPEQDPLLRIAFVLKLTASDTQQMLKIGRRALLTASRRRDVAIMYGLENRLMLEEMDALLVEYGLAPLLPQE